MLITTNYSHTSFSQKDDDILLETLSEPGIRLMGNLVYKKLADQVRIVGSPPANPMLTGFSIHTIQCTAGEAAGSIISLN